jgi:predicted  nucleic acid-binding Zn-ribbon protein
MSDLLEEGGEYEIKRTDSDEYQFNLSISTDEQGMIGRGCIDENCSPGYFKVKIGTGITSGQTVAYCPYCRQSAEPSKFISKLQGKYFNDVITTEMFKGMDKGIRSALGLDSSGKRVLGSGMITAELSMEPPHFPRVDPPIEMAISRVIKCPNCGLVHGVFGLATWCPDCGSDIFLSHLEKELETISKTISVIEQRRKDLGSRVADRDIENSLEDIVSILEAVLKIIIRKYLLNKGTAVEQVNELIENRIRNQFQNPTLATELINEITGINLFEGISEQDISFVKTSFEKRHPITHNLGVIDRKYLKRAINGELEGNEIRITVDEVEKLISLSRTILSTLYSRLILNDK